MKVNKLIVCKTILLLAMAFMVTSCGLMPEKGNTQQAVEGAIATPASWATKTEVEGVSTQWLESFNDQVLLELIKEGKENNIDLKVTATNMERSWLLAKQAGAPLKPTLDLSVGDTQSDFIEDGSSSGQFNVGLSSSWELDVWGRIRASVDVAVATAESTVADYTFAQYSLSANIAKTYFQIIEAKLQADIARKNISLLTETMRITQVKYDNGVSSGKDVALNRANLASAQEQLYKIEGGLRNLLRSLEVFLGRYPNATLEISYVLPKLPSPPADIPSQILERRPDLISAERKIVSAFSATTQAKAARLPKFGLTSQIGGSSTALSEILNPANVIWQLAANIVMPLFDGGRRRIDVEIANVLQKQSIKNYATTALNAFSEVENNLDQGLVLANRKIALNEAFEQSTKAYNLAEISYKAGEIDLLDTLQLQQQAISAESNLLFVKRAQLEQRINLYLALGGSW